VPFAGVLTDLNYILSLAAQECKWFSIVREMLVKNVINADKEILIPRQLNMHKSAHPELVVEG
jgi:hypothetical protein